MIVTKKQKNGVDQAKGDYDQSNTQGGDDDPKYNNLYPNYN